MEELHNRFLSEMGRADLEERTKYACGDCKYFKKKKCPVNVEYDLAQPCFMYAASKDQKKFQKELFKKKTIKVWSMTMTKRNKIRRKKKLKLKDKISRKVFTEEGFVQCNLKHGYRIREFVHELIQRENWKCERKRCKNRMHFKIRVKHPTRHYRLDEDTIYKITDVMINLRLVCPSCNFVHTFPDECNREIKEFVRELKQEKIFQKEPETDDEMQLMTRYVSQIAFPDGFENDPLFSFYRGTTAYKAVARKIRKIAKKNELIPSKIIGVIYNKSRGCLVMDNATFILIPSGIFVA